MSFQSNGVDISLLAAADLTSSQYLAIKVDANGKAALAGAGESCIGILQNNPNSGQPATVRVAGVSKMVASGALTAGALIASDGAGKAKAAVKGTTNTSDAGAANDPAIGSDVLGILLKSAGGANEIVPVLVEPRGLVATTAG
jgi:hypothetical protein